jgi:1-acyl-sn-glycerol-3-phosphate acyltransferase
MTLKPRRLTFGRKPAGDRPLVEGDPTAWILPRRRSVIRTLRPVWRLALVLPWTLACALLQGPLLLLPAALRGGRAAGLVPRLYWRGMCAILGLGLRIVGTPARTGADGRPVVYVSNHSSWVDILALGARLDAAFIAKEEVAGWPVIGWIARLGRTVYVRRARTSTARERDEMRARLAGGDSLILFPEGTTSDGARVLPFRSAFLSIAELPATAAGLPPIVQPISIVYDRLAGLPMGRSTRPVLAWYGDMDIATHYWQLAQYQGMRASILLHPPLDPRDFPNRKALTQAVWQACADGAALLRQNRPAAAPAARPGDPAAAPSLARA